MLDPERCWKGAGADAIEKFIADWNGRADAGRWKHAAQADDNVWDNELK